MDVKQAIAAARTYLDAIYAADGISDIEIEETEHDVDRQRWSITMAFVRPWKTPRTRAQEMLEQLGAVSGTRRAMKTVTLSDDGEVLSMKNYARPEAVG